MLFSKFSSLLLLALPALISAYNTDKDDVPKDRKHKVIHILPNGAGAGVGEMRAFGSKTHGAEKVERLVYYVDKGNAIMGDINLGPEEEVLKLSKNKSHKRAKGSNRHQARGLSIFADSTDRKWPNANIIYKYQNADAENELKEWVDKAIGYWKTASPFLRFTQLPTNEPHKPGTMMVQMTSGAGACWAPVGWCKDCYLTMQLDTLNCNIATYVHEFGHAIGLYHEHQRPDRDEFMNFNCSALADYHTYGTDSSSCPGEPEKCCADATCYGWACSFAHINYLDYHGPLDLKSVMIYQEYSFSAGYYPTLSGINGHEVPAWEQEIPSDGDKTRICEIYNEECKNGSTDLVPRQVCGDGKREGSEECDDGNTVDDDGCSSKRTIEDIDPGNKCEQCDPNPMKNRCDITTSCISTHPGGPTMCACRAGYKANPGYDSADLAQWRLPMAGLETRVFVKPGIICNELCQDWATGGKDGVLCGEVSVKNDC
ncbi:hypothetical protein BDZ91DRAFT_473579 [Kalaharituber pfeilii]|nr:hypothetical protein BDZ91DRAFT_473579 [Kalaharituber pfeilii]